jgi:hypothetical protein
MNVMHKGVLQRCYELLTKVADDLQAEHNRVWLGMDKDSLVELEQVKASFVECGEIGQLETVRLSLANLIGIQCYPPDA